MQRRLAALFVMLAAFALLSPATAQEALDCNAMEELSSLRSDYGGGGDAACRLWSASDFGLQVFYPASWGATPDSEQLALLSLLAAAVDAARESYVARGFIPSSVMRTHPINLGYSLGHAPRPAADGTPLAAEANGDTPATDCDIIAFEESLRGMSSADIKQLIAHEVFHCVQIFHFPQHYSPASYWWQEGAAEMASGLVYPANNREHFYTRQYAQTRILFDHSYAAALFFQDFLNQNGMLGLIDFLHALPDSNDPLDQYAMLSAYPRFGDNFHIFGQHFVDHAVTDPGGGVMAQAGAAAHREILLEHSGPHTISTTSFTLDAYQVRLRAGRRFRITGLAPDAEDVEVSWRFVGEAGHWNRAEPGAAIEAETDCVNDRGLFILATSTRDSADFIDIEFEAEVEELECEACACEGPVPACAVGEWRVDDIGQWAPYWAQVSAMMGGIVTFAQERGEIDIGISRNGAFSETFATSATGKGVPAPGSRPITIATNISGVNGGTMCRVDAGHLCRTFTESHINVDTKGYVGDDLQFEKTYRAPPVRTAVHAFECRGDRLMMQADYPLEPPLSIEFELSRQ